MNQRSKQSPHWDSFWARDNVNTFGLGDKNYEGFVEAFWDKHFRALAPNATILDVASGNGAIALLAEAVGNKLDKHFDISACDIAHITSRQPDSGITFYSGVDIAKTGFDSSHYQLITSQYGFEYCDCEAGLVEIHRLLSPGGEFIAFTHHDQSILVKTAHQICGFLNGPVKQDDPLGLARDLVKASGEIRGRQDQERLQHNKKSEKIRKKFNRLIEKYSTDHGAAMKASALLDYINPLFSQGLYRPVRDKLAYLKNCSREMHHDLRRQLDLVDAAMDDEKTAILLQQAETLELQCLSNELVQVNSGEILGRILHFKKADL
jgi:SAM-dependent methyltransferase